MRRYCLTYEYPGVCWTYASSTTPLIFYECDESYNMLSTPINGVVKLNFKQWILPKDYYKYGINR